jgi:GNAT superfamily N-acetyltransferase
MDGTASVNPRIEMLREHMRNLPSNALPRAFSARPMSVRDVSLWTDIWRDVEDSSAISDSLFENSFGQDWDLIGKRCFIVFDEAGRSAGTISAWFDKSFAGYENCGRIHYVAVRKAFQNRGLGRAMLGFALGLAAELGHKQCHLVTQTFRLPALKLYFEAGFKPYLDGPEALASWKAVAERLPAPLLRECLEEAAQEGK